MSDDSDTILPSAAPVVGTQPIMRPLASVETKEVCTALAKAQGEFESPKRTKKAKVKGRSRAGHDYEYEYSYAPLEDVIHAVQKPLAEAGLSRQQYLVTRGDMWFVRTIIWHVSGQWISSDYPVLPEEMTSQKFAGAVTYSKRQGLSLALGVAAEDDDDAQEADGLVPGKVAPAQRPRRPSPPAPPHDPETGEVRGPHRIPVPEGANRWIEWGSTFVAAIKTSHTKAELDAWHRECAVELSKMSLENKAAHGRVKANIAEQEERLKPKEVELMTEEDISSALSQSAE